MSELPTIRFSEPTRSIVVNGTVSKLTKDQFAVARFLNERPGSTVRGSEIREGLVKGGVDISTKQVQNGITGLRSRLPQQLVPVILPPMNGKAGYVWLPGWTPTDPPGDDKPDSEARVPEEFWTPSRLEQLQRLCEQEVRPTALEVSRILGGTCTRQRVIRKVEQLGLPKLRPGPKLSIIPGPYDRELFDPPYLSWDKPVELSLAD